MEIPKSPTKKSQFDEEPPWGEYYKKFDPKLVELFRQSYDEARLSYYRVKCSKNLENALEIYKNHVVESNKITDKITTYAPTSESMPRELLNGVSSRRLRFGGNLTIREILRIPKEKYEEYSQRKRISWITRITSEVSKEDHLELEKLELAQNQKKSGE